MPSDIEVPHMRPDWRDAAADFKAAVGIPQSEPIFIVRAKDINAAKTVQFWVQAGEAAGVSNNTLDHARNIANAMHAWPTKKVPDVPGTPDTPSGEIVTHDPTTHAYPGKIADD